MKQENKIPISELIARLQAHTNDPEPESAFDAAFYMWKQYCLRHHIHKRQFFSQNLQKGWIRREHADHFWNCITGQERF
jgi:hypothetical protein